MGIPSILLIPHFIEARSPSGLQRLMLKTNVKDGKQYIYRDIQFVKGRWIAWFDKQIDRTFEKQVRVEEVSGNSQETKED